MFKVKQRMVKKSGSVAIIVLIIFTIIIFDVTILLNSICSIYDDNGRYKSEISKNYNNGFYEDDKDKAIRDTLLNKLNIMVKGLKNSEEVKAYLKAEKNILIECNGYKLRYDKILDQFFLDDNMDRRTLKYYFEKGEITFEINNMGGN